MTPKERFVLETEEYRDPDQAEGTWSKLRCKVMEVKDNGDLEQIGEFFRNYSCLYDTWEPFEQDGKHYALCSPHYTSTSVMALPECEIIASEPKSSFGFCPTGFYVPDSIKEAYDDDMPEPLREDWLGKFGFVCGCVWGDDSSWKVEFFDLSEITQGKLTRDARFGYIELAGDRSLEQSIFVEGVTNEDMIMLRILSERWWGMGLKWTAPDAEDGEPIDINALADELQKRILVGIKYATRSDDKAAMRALLNDDTFRDSVRENAVAILSNFAKEK